MLAAIRPRDHLTWYKVLLINELLADHQWEWVVWLDADAVVVRPEVTVEALATRRSDDSSGSKAERKSDGDRGGGGGGGGDGVSGAGGSSGGGSGDGGGWRYGVGHRNGPYGRGKSAAAGSHNERGKTTARDHRAGDGAAGVGHAAAAADDDDDDALDGVPHLVVGEDLTPTCKINAGVMIIRGSSWSRRLWADVWKCERWRTKPFHEQSSMIRWLKVNEPGFASAVPWHSWDGADVSGHRECGHVTIVSL
jgi:hypothetical protein